MTCGIWIFIIFSLASLHVSMIIQRNFLSQGKYKFLYLQSHCDFVEDLKGFFTSKMSIVHMMNCCWFRFSLPVCHERVFDWVIKNENWWPEFILNSCWGLSKDLHNFHQLHLHGKIFYKISNNSRSHICMNFQFNHNNFMYIQSSKNQ